MRELAFMACIPVALIVMFSAGTRVLVDLNLLMEGQPVTMWRTAVAGLVAYVAFKLTAETWRRA